MFEWHRLNKKSYPPEGYVLLAIDYGHQPIYVMGYCSKENGIYYFNYHGEKKVDHRMWRSTRWATIEINEPEK